MLFPHLNQLPRTQDQRPADSVEFDLKSVLLPQYQGSPTVPLVQEFLNVYGPSTLLNGSYGIFDQLLAYELTQAAVEAFPSFSGHVIAFGRDWLGYLYCADFSRIEKDWPTVVVFDVNTGDAMTTNLDLEAFHEQAVVDNAASLFNLDFYEAWLTQHPPMLIPQRAVGYRIPLALGGEDTIENLEEADLAVYWSVTGQIGVPSDSAS